jgi:hypothetical protein
LSFPLLPRPPLHLISSHLFASRRYLYLLRSLYFSAPGAAIPALERLKKLATDVLTSLPDAVKHLNRLRQTDGHRNGSSTTSSTTTAAGGDVKSVGTLTKLLLEDVAVLRRIGRIPDSSGVDAKALLRSGRGIS